MKPGKRPLYKKIMASPLTLAAVFVVLFFVSKAAWNINRQVQASSNRLNEAEASLDSLKARQADLSRKVMDLSTDEGIEAEIRVKYHAVKDGESVAVIIDDEAATSSVAQASTTSKTSLLRRLLQSIGL